MPPCRGQAAVGQVLTFTQAFYQDLTRRLFRMNPIRWLLKVSADAAMRRAGAVLLGTCPFDATVDSRDDEMWIEIDGTALFISNRKQHEIWSQLSPDRLRFARASHAKDGSHRLTVYERTAAGWREWEGPSVLETVDDAVALGPQLLSR